MTNITEFSIQTSKHTSLHEIMALIKSPENERKEAISIPNLVERNRT